MREPELFDTLYGRFLLYPEDNISTHLINNEFWEEELKDVFDKNLTKEDVVVEVGSYIGDHTVYLSKLCKKVFAYEGTVRNYYQLCANLLLNGCENVIASNFIIGDGSSVRQAVKEKGDAWGLDLDNNASGARFVYENGVVTLTLDSLISEPIKLLKIDAEGMDLAILRGSEQLIRANKPIIIFEYNMCVSPPLQDHYDFLKHLGYSCERIGTYNWVANYG